MARVSTADFWDGLYATGGDGWELGQPATPLVDFVEQTPPPRGRVAVPGCGRGHDARFLAARGYEVVGYDFSSAALTAARALARRDNVAVAFEQRDIFTLGREAAHAFDGVWEYTCFCAIDPARRAEYVASLAGAVRPGGWLLGCFFPLRGSPAGPPFPVSMDEVRRVLRPAFRIDRDFMPLRSVRGRQGREWMVLARRTGA
jgi:SAM-dependent methyltransferase